MEVIFKTEELYLLYEGKQKKTKFSSNIIKQYVKKIRLIKDAENLSQLSLINSLNVEKFEEHYSLRLNDQYRLEFNFIKPNTVEILKISKHYEK
jgi:plasmid maintenance system killer protein